MKIFVFTILFFSFGETNYDVSFCLLIKHFMISKTFNRYIWLLNILLQRKKLTLEEICEEWNKSYLGDNTPLSKRTFHQHRNAIEELFDVSIKCDTSNGYRYYISNPEVIQGNKTRKWLLNSFSLSNRCISNTSFLLNCG